MIPQTSKEIAVEIQAVCINLLDVLLGVHSKYEFFDFADTLQEATASLVEVAQANLECYEATSEGLKEMMGAVELTKVLSLLEQTLSTLIFLCNNKEPALRKPMLLGSFKQRVTLLLNDWVQAL